jgi:integrase
MAQKSAHRVKILENTCGATIFDRVLFLFRTHCGSRINEIVLTQCSPETALAKEPLRIAKPERANQMTILNINRKNIASLPAVDGKWWDTGLKGFGYKQRMSARGELLCSYVIQYRFNRIQRKLKIGDANKINADQARKIAIKLFGQIANGTDPLAVKEAQRVEAAKATFAQAVEQYLAAKATQVRESSLRTAKLYLTGPAYFPTLHRKPVDSVTHSDIAPHLDRMGRDIGTASAGLARSHLSSFFAWALMRDFGCKENPVLKTEAPKAESESTRALSGDELRTIWLACDDSDYGRIVRLLILTGCRREEIGGLRWSEINLDDGTLTVPVERSKNHRAHTLPLSGMALDIIRAIPRREGIDHLFGARGDGFKIWGYSKKALLASTGTMADWRLHDLRHTVSTGMHELGVEPHHVESILNHVSGHKDGVAGRYNHATYLAQMSRALAMWADHVQSVVTGKPAKVRAIRAA